MTKDERLRLQFLSKELYGTSSKYLKMVRNGEKVPKSELKTYEIKRYTEKEIGPFMEELYKEEMELKASQEAEALEQKRKREEEKAEEASQETEEARPDVVKEILETVES